MISRCILYCYNHGLSNYIYNGCVNAGLIVQALSLILYRKAYGFTLKRAFQIYILIYPVLFVWMFFITWVEFGFSSWGSRNVLRLYMWVPLILLPYSRLLKIPHGVLADYFAPSLALTSVIGHAGCPFAGCCYGYPCRWGIYNPELHDRRFPIQWVECSVSLLIAIFLLWYAKKNKYNGSGKVNALFLILFGSTRFFLEFLRDNHKLFWGISELAVIAFLTFATGAVWMVFLCRREKKKCIASTT